MKEFYMKLSKSYKELSEVYSQLAKEQRVEEKPKGDVTIEMLRAVLAQKSKDGKIQEVKELLMKHNAVKLSDINKNLFRELLIEAEAL
ncbi:MAG: hypothetical protein ACRC7N_04475 [Clostridium sp.]